MQKSSYLAFIFVVAVLLIVTCGEPAPVPTPTPTPILSLEYKLAVLHRGGYVAENDPLVARFGRALDRLVAKCPETRQQLADMGVKGRQMLSERQINEALVDVLENWRASIPDEMTKGQFGPCREILVGYLTLRIGG